MPKEMAGIPTVIRVVVVWMMAIFPPYAIA